ncbi:S8 family serine peptidase [Nocardiopsis sp. FIRDI 009]|uniref:S8 family peptidase n=1 Tax=Nocardiopsis sp. FIRDI 009 TaxID=714197 RepID=UPI000E244071|nr:S8 family serine peptidase [Nocardiopsis sp. FIRDI 009]
MRQKCTVLRDTGSPSTTGPFDLGGLRRPSALAATAEAAGEPVVEVLEMDKHDLDDAARDPRVRAVAPVMPTLLIEPTPHDTDEATTVDDTRTWGVAAVGADTSSATGAGVTVAVLDTGIDAEHPAFSGVDLVQRDFTGSGVGDRQGHGTHVAGTVFGRDVDGTRIGVARGVERGLVGKVLDDRGRGDSEMLLQGIQWAVDQGAHVVSMSLGYDFPGLVSNLVDQGWPADLATSSALEAYRANLRMFDSLLDLLRARAAFGQGTVVVAAAGNESRREVHPDYEIAVSLPAAAEGVVSVGALGQGGSGLTIAPFSNTFPQISAPGVGVLSARTGSGLVAFNGTSMACPHVAGVAALWWERVLSESAPHAATTVTSRLLAHADTGAIDSGVAAADRGVGIVRAP